MDIEKYMIEESAARTFFVNAWADEMEEQGRSFPPGSELMNLAPRTPSSAIKAAYRFVGALENANNKSILVLANEAAKADGKVLTEMPSQDLKEYVSDFAHYMVMEGLGHGVAWTDNHAEFPIDVPNYENPLYGDPATRDYGDSIKPR